MQRQHGHVNGTMNHEQLASRPGDGTGSAAGGAGLPGRQGACRVLPRAVRPALPTGRRTAAAGRPGPERPGLAGAAASRWRLGLAFQQVPGLPAPTWPEGPRPQMLHLDTTVPTVDDLFRPAPAGAGPRGAVSCWIAPTTRRNRCTYWPTPPGTRSASSWPGRRALSRPGIRTGAPAGWSRVRPVVLLPGPRPVVALPLAPRPIGNRCGPV